VWTEFDGMSEAELKKVLDELESGDPIAGLATLERATQSQTRPVRLEAKRRLPRVRRLVEAKERESLRRRQLQKVAALVVVGALPLGGISYAVSSLLTRPKPAPDPAPSVEAPPTPEPAHSAKPSPHVSEKPPPAPTATPRPTPEPAPEAGERVPLEGSYV